MKIKYSETFFSFQGEGYYTGKITNWVRFFACNLTCAGFSQPDPTDPSTYIDPLASIDLSNIKKIEDLPVVEYGCDSIYSWNKDFRHLALTATEQELADILVNLNKSATNPEGAWIHPLTNEPIHMAFTGGESMMSQYQVIALMEEFYKRGDYPRFVTFETNGTKPLRKEFVEWFNSHSDIEVLFSISPKLHTVSGELPEKAWKPDNFISYQDQINNSITQVKFVVRDCDDSKTELLERISEIKDKDVMIYGMPVGATKEQQEEYNPDFIMWLLHNGVNISGRLHAHLMGNVVGV